MMSFWSRMADNRGFTVVEILLGIAILAVAIVPVINYFLNGTWLVRSSESRAQALKLARDSLEIIRAEAEKDWAGLSGFIDNFSLADVYDTTGAEYDLLTDYQLTASFRTDFDFNGDGDLTNDLALGRAVTVRVSWSRNNGVVDGVELRTLVANR